MKAERQRLSAFNGYHPSSLRKFCLKPGESLAESKGSKEREKSKANRLARNT